MWKFWQHHAPVWKPEGEGAGAGGGAGEGGQGEGGEAGAGEGGESQGGSSILDFAQKPAALGNKASEGEGGEWKLPEGVELPDHLMGTTADETLAKLSKAYLGSRKELSQKGKAEGKLEGSVPDSPDGYKFEAEGDDDKVAQELNSEASKPYVDAFRKAAHELGIPDQAFSQLMRQGLAGIADGGMPIGASTEEAQQISGDAEMKALSDDVGKAEARTIINTIGVYADKLQARGVLKDDADIAEFSQMVGTARAAKIFHTILTGELGEKPIPPSEGMDATVSSTQAYANHAAASKMPPGAERDEAMKEAQAGFGKAFGTNPTATGSVRSNVL